MSVAVKEHVTKQVIDMLKKEMGDETGASAAEYALILAIIGTAVAASMIILGDSISSAVTTAAGKISPP
jgi:pilus assembly protein Flp/PilA